MYQAFLINLAIVALILVGVLATGNPLFLMGLLLLQHMPVVVPRWAVPPMDEDDDPKIGFHADL